jgi:uncharacterized protein
MIKPLSLPVLERAIQDACASASRIKFLWHGGEPMLAGMSFYEKALEFQARYRLPGQAISNHIQTNATLINGRWAEFFAHYHFRVSTSIDGPSGIHDAYRANKAGQGSFDDVVRGIRRLQALGERVGVIITLTKVSVAYPDEIFQTILELGEGGYEINVCSDTTAGTEDIRPSTEEAIACLSRIFDLWFGLDNPAFRIRLFMNTLRALRGGLPNDCAFRYNRCRDFVAIDESGDIYPCARFLKEAKVYMGNVLSDGLQNTLKSQAATQLYDCIAKVKEECLSCEWIEACGGGCAYQRWLHRGQFDDPFPLCQVRKGIFAHVRKRLVEAGFSVVPRGA